MGGQKWITAEYIFVRADPGTHLNNALRSAVLLATAEDTPVRLKFNDKLYHIEPAQIVQRLLDQHPDNP